MNLLWLKKELPYTVKQDYTHNHFPISDNFLKEICTNLVQNAWQLYKRLVFSFYFYNFSTDLGYIQAHTSLHTHSIDQKSP